MIRIAPSILSADFVELGRQIETAEKAGADWIHCDIMDGHFVPNITFGPMVVEAARRVTSLPLDVHLMIENPDAYLSYFVEAGANSLTVHVEACRHLHRTVNEIKNLGAKAGVALNPATPVGVLENILPDVDLILIMSVNPGFGGQKFIKETGTKLHQASAMIEESGREIQLEVDGGIDRTTAASVVRKGARILVAGSAIFKSDDIAKAIQELRDSAEAGAAGN